MPKENAMTQAELEQLARECIELLDEKGFDVGGHSVTMGGEPYFAERPNLLDLATLYKVSDKWAYETDSSLYWQDTTLRKMRKSGGVEQYSCCLKWDNATTWKLIQKAHGPDRITARLRAFHAALKANKEQPWGVMPTDREAGE